MPEKALAELTSEELDKEARITRWMGVVVAVALVVILGNLVFTVIEQDQGSQMTFLVTFSGFTLFGVFGLTLTTANQSLRLRRDLWDLMQKMNDSGG